MIKHNKCKGLVYDVIKEYASEDKPLSQTQILDKIKENPDNTCNRRTVARALKDLITEYGMDEDGDWIHENIHLHYNEIPRGDSPILKDFWLEFDYEDEFSDEELLFLMDAVQFSKHVDQKQAEDIAKKLAKLSHNRFSGIFEMHMKLNEKNTPVRTDFFVILGMINDAIHLQKMVTFYNNEYGADKRLHHVGNEPVKVCPYKVVGSEGNYYLLCGEKGAAAIKKYRIDRISDVSVLEETFTHSAARINAAVHTNDYIVEHCYMNTGETVKVTLEVDKIILGDVIDTFGTKIKIDPAHPSVNRLIVHVKSSEKDIIDWSMRYGEYAMILEPDYLRDEIKGRASLLESAYSDKNAEIEYLQHIRRSESCGHLSLNNIDLNNQYTYKELTGIKTAIFRRNGIKDFSFLADYDELRELTISHNEISDPHVISGLEHLVHLSLNSTGITNLDFLTGLERLSVLSLHEYTLENVEAIYTLPKLRRLTINKPISKLIDMNRIRRVFGNSLEVVVENRASTMPLHINSRLPKETVTLKKKALIEELDTFVTCDVTDASVRSSLISQIYAGTDMSGRYKKFVIIDESCSGYERLELLEDVDIFAGDEYSWYVTYKGPEAERICDVDEDDIYAISIFKQDHGLKLVCMAMRNIPLGGLNNPTYGVAYKENAFPGTLAHIRHLLNNNIGWAEISGELERRFRLIGTINDVINPANLVNHKVFNDIEIGADGYHYYRSVAGEKIPVKMIAYGNISFWQ